MGAKRNCQKSYKRMGRHLYPAHATDLLRQCLDPYLHLSNRIISIRVHPLRIRSTNLLAPPAPALSLLENNFFTESRLSISGKDCEKHELSCLEAGDKLGRNVPRHRGLRCRFLGTRAAMSYSEGEGWVCDAGGGAFLAVSRLALLCRQAGGWTLTSDEKRC